MKPKRNYFRRTIGAVICLSPFGVLAASIFCCNRAPSSYAIWFLVPGTIIAILNLYLSLLRPLRYRWRGQPTEDYRHISGIPLIGTLLILAAAVIGFGSFVVATAGIAATLADTGSPFWFLVATWKDQSLWDT
jgi:hypothetical protein